MKISKERVLIDTGRAILENTIPDVIKTPGYLGWRIVETADFLPRKDYEIEIRAIFMIIKVDGDAKSSEVTAHIEEIEEKAYKDFADIVVDHELEGKVNIFVLFEIEE